MSHKPYVIDTMISAKSIAARIEDLSRDIQTTFEGTDKLVVVGLLRGSFVFIADLVRELDLPVEVDFLEASSYGDGMESSREVRIFKDLRGAIEGRDVLVVEDIIDTGHTLAHVHDYLMTKKPVRMRTIGLWHRLCTAQPQPALCRQSAVYAMNPRWLLHAKRWAQNPPSAKKLIIVAGVVAVSLILYGLETQGLLPDWMAADGAARIR